MQELQDYLIEDKFAYITFENKLDTEERTGEIYIKYNINDFLFYKVTSVIDLFKCYVEDVLLYE